MCASSSKDPIAEFIQALRRGEDPSIEEFVHCYPQWDLDQLRGEIEGAWVLFWGGTVPHVSDERLQEALAVLREARDRIALKRGLQSKLEQIPTTGALTVGELTRWLTERIGLALKPVGSVPEPHPIQVRFRGKTRERKDSAKHAYGILRSSQVKTAAEDLLSRGLIAEPPIDLSSVSDIASVVVEEKPLVDCEGCTFQFEEGTVIYINSKIENEMRRRFTWAHELGHAVLHPKQPQWMDTYAMIQKSWSRRERTQEVEANRFAAELLMPFSMLEADKFPQSEPHFETIANAADRYKVSLTAAAIRFVEITDAAASLYYVEEDRIVWAVRSNFFELPWRKGTIHPTSGLKWVRAEREYYEEVPLEAWTSVATAETAVETGRKIGERQWIVLIVRE